MSVAERVGDWMQTASGRRFWPLDPRASEIHIEDIAHSLAFQCRFAGHTRAYYSVAEHSVRVSLVCDPRDALWGLLHDAPEAYLIDLPRPIKRQPALAAYREAEGRVWRAVCERFGLDRNLFSQHARHLLPESVKRADQVLLATEARDLMGGGNTRWDSTRYVEPLPERLEPWAPETARRRFLERFEELTGGSREAKAGYYFVDGP